MGLLGRPFYKSLESHHDLNRLQAVPPFQCGPSHDSKKLCDKRIMELLSVCLAPRVQNDMSAIILFFPFFCVHRFHSSEGLLEVYYLTPFIFSLLKVQLIYMRLQASPVIVITLTKKLVINIIQP